MLVTYFKNDSAIFGEQGFPLQVISVHLEAKIDKSMTNLFSQTFKVAEMKYLYF